MLLKNLKITSDTLFRLLFHLLFWGMLLGWPFFSSAGNEEWRRMSIRMIPVSLTHIPLFLLNTEWLFPKVLRRKGIASYLLSLLVLVAAFTALQVIMRGYIFEKPELHHIQRHVFITLIFVMMVTGIATAYGFITTMAHQEKARQEEHQERLQSELSFLRSQISPHFIFNILNSIVYLIRSRSSQAEPVTIKLSELMRYMLYESGDTQVPLDKELDYLKNYVELQKLRFEDDVDIRLHIEGATGGQIIEPMLMIPFIENAFKHGVGLIQDPVIDISVEFDEENLLFSIRNKVASELPEDKDSSSGIGLRNVKRRLELLYPEHHRLHIQRENNWFTVTLQLQFSHHDKAMTGNRFGKTTVA